MEYELYFDESNKLDQADGGFSYYGALGISSEIRMKLMTEIQQYITSTKELHFAEYKNDRKFGIYFNCFNYIMQQDLHMNIIIVKNDDALSIGRQMNVSVKDLRNLFYVKIPERLFYGLTRNLSLGDQVNIVVDNNQEYETLGVYKKLEEQMNAHSAYRNKGYKIRSVQPQESDKALCLQIIDNFLGIVVFLIEKQYSNIHTADGSIVTKIKSDLIYRFLSEGKNIQKIQGKINLYQWDAKAKDEIKRVNFGDFLSEFFAYKTNYDVMELIRLERIKTANPKADTKFYREEMGYSNRELFTILGYLDQLSGKGRNGYFI